MVLSCNNLSLRQKGFFEKTFAFFVYLVSAVLIVFFLDYLDKKTFLAQINRAFTQGILSQDNLPVLHQLISGRSEQAFSVYIAIFIIYGFISWRIIRIAGNINLQRYDITLDSAVEFKYCMNSLGISCPQEALDIAIRYNMPFYIAKETLDEQIKHKIEAKFYAYSFDSVMRDRNFIERSLGRQTLCFSLNDFEQLKEKYLKKFEKRESSEIELLNKVIAEKITEIELLNKKLQCSLSKNELFDRSIKEKMSEINFLNESLKEKMSENELLNKSIGEFDELIMRKDEKIDELQQENSKLIDENKELRRKQQTFSAREGKGEETRDIKKIPYWRIAIPTVERLLQEATPTTKYTSSQIQTAFEKELERFPHLQEAIKVYFAARRQTERDNPFSLDGWPMRMIRAALEEYIQTEPGTPKKSCA